VYKRAGQLDPSAPEIDGTILVVDDDARFRALVHDVLSGAGYRVREAETGSAARSQVREQRPAVVLLDVNLPDVSGYELCRELRDDFGDGLPIVFVSGAKTDQLDRVGGLLLGADEYLVKPFDPDELIARVRRFAARVGLQTKSRSKARAPHTLTPRELDVLKLLAQGRSQKEIARDLFISSKTVATHIQRILGKLKVHSRAQAVAVAHRKHLIDSPARS
jgi:two-component system phosphate regulon response regulator OmpR